MLLGVSHMVCHHSLRPHLQNTSRRKTWASIPTQPGGDSSPLDVTSVLSVQHTSLLDCIWKMMQKSVPVCWVALP